MPVNKLTKILLVLIALTLLAVGCTDSNEGAQRGGDNAVDEQQQIQTGFNRLSDAQQIPTFDWSQERQTVIDVETARATGAVSTTAGYLEGVGLVWWCPSQGAPVPSTYQLSATEQWVDIPGDEHEELYNIDQGEPTGVYVGDSSGTWTMCLDDNGNTFAKYWEGYVDSTIGVVTTYPAELRVRLDEATFEFTENPEGDG